MYGKNVLITGASSGIGREFAKIFAKEKNNLILVARNRDKLEKLRTDLLEEDVQITIIEKDLAQPNAAQELYGILQSKGIKVNVLINNAGFGLSGYIVDIPIAEQLQMIQLNIVTLTHLTHLFVQDMIADRYGRILNVASIASFMATPSLGTYAATKAYVLSFSEALSTELRMHDNVFVTALCPGPTRTQFSERACMRGRGRELFDEYGMSAKEVAKHGYMAMKNKKAVTIAGGQFHLLVWATRFIPRKWVQKSITKLT